MRFGSESAWWRTGVASVLVAGVCVIGAGSEMPGKADDLTSGEAFIDAFYSFDPQSLDRLVAAAEDGHRALYYQAWAKAANYEIKTRRQCVAQGRAVRCAITVTDDFGRTLGYTATDTFTLTMERGRIVGVAFEADDPPIFDKLFKWIGERQPEVLIGPCKDAFAGGTTPGECARAVVAAAREFVKTQQEAL